MSDLKTTAHMSVYLDDRKGKVFTLGDVRRFVSKCDEFGVPDSHVMEECLLSITVFADRVEPTLDLDEQRTDVLLVMPR